MTDRPHRITTAEGLARFNAARDVGGLCAVCGRVLGDGEPVYIGPVLVDRNAFAPPGVHWSMGLAPRDAPLGAECVSPKLLARLEGRTPERCTGCERPVFYAKDRAQRRRATCSYTCRNRAEQPDRRGPSGEKV